jgi:hypothetical protein
MDYESQARRHLNEWQREMLAEPGLIDRAARRLQAKVNGFIPERVHEDTRKDKSEDRDHDDGGQNRPGDAERRAFVAPQQFSFRKRESQPHPKRESLIHRFGGFNLRHRSNLWIRVCGFIRQPQSLSNCSCYAN